MDAKGNGQRVRELLALNMKRTRKKLKISQSELAAMCEVSTSFIAEIEICRKFPSPTTLDKLATVLSLEPYQLFLDEWRWETHDKTGVMYHLRSELKQRILRDVDAVMNPYIIQR